MNKILMKQVCDIFKRIENNEDCLLLAVEIGRIAVNQKLNIDEKILAKNICDLVIIIYQDKVNIINEELYKMLIDVSNSIDLEIKDLDDLIQSLLIPKVSHLHGKNISVVTYKTISEFYDDARAVLLNKINSRNSSIASFKRAYVYNIVLLLLNEIEERNIKVNDSQIISLLNLVSNNEMFIEDAKENSKEVNNVLNYRLLKII